MHTTYKVDGMNCGGCVRSVKSAIQELHPQLIVDVSLEDGTAGVDGPVTAEQVKKAVEDAGFEFGGRA